MGKKFFIRFIAIVALALLLSSLYYLLLCKGLRSVKKDGIGKFNYIASDTTYYNTVFFGASTVHTHIDAQLFDSITKMHSFNAGMDGIRIAEMQLLIKKYIKSHKAPCNLFINIDPSTVSTDCPVYYFPQYFPFVNDTDLDNLTRIEPRLNFAKYCPPLALTYFDDALKNLGLIGLLKNASHDDTVPLRGFTPVNEHEFMGDSSKYNSGFVMTEKARPFLDEALRLCVVSNARIYLIIGTRYNSSMNDRATTLFMSELDTLKKQYNFTIINLSDDPKLKNKDLYIDRQHLNKKGAYIYTKDLAEAFLKRNALQ